MANESLVTGLKYLEVKPYQPFTLEKTSFPQNSSSKYGVEFFGAVAEQLKFRKHTKETDVTRKYEVYTLEGDAEYQLQIPKDETNRTMSVDRELFGMIPSMVESKVNASEKARLWVTDKEGPDGPVAVCFKLLEYKDKSIWVRQDSRKVRSESNINYWSLSSAVDRVSDDSMYSLTAAMYRASRVNDGSKTGFSNN